MQAGPILTDRLESFVQRSMWALLFIKNKVADSNFPGLPVGERQAFSTEGSAERLNSIWPDAMELLEFCFADFG